METLLNCLYVAVVILAFFLIIGLISHKSIYCKSRKHVATFAGIPLVLCFLVFKPLSEMVEYNKRVQMYHEEQRKKDGGITGSSSYTNEYQQTSAETRQRKIEVFPVRRSVREGYFVYAVEEFSFRKSFGSDFGSTADGIYLIIRIAMMNLSDEPRRFPFDDFYVTDKNGARYTFQDYTTTLFRSETSSVMDWDFDKFNGLRRFQPNIAARDYMIFEVPQKGNYYLNFYGSPNVVALE